MKKNLAIRAGAIVLVLMVAFLSIIPDLVNAEGEDPEPSTEVAAEVPDAGAGAPETEAPDPSEGETPGGGATDWSAEVPPVTETPDTPEPETQEPETQQPETQEPAVPEPEPPATDGGSIVTEPVPQPAEPEMPETEPTESAPTEDAGSREPSYELGDDTPTDNMTAVGLPEDGVVLAETDFIVEGTTVTGYSGAGGNIVIPDGVTAISDGVFAGNGSITGVSFPGSLQIIGSSAFEGCSSLESVSMPGSVTIVGSAAFANCTALGSVSLSGSAGAVSAREFYNCSSLVNVSVPDGVTSIGAEAFGSCVNLSSISLPSTLSSLDMSAFSGDVNLGSISVSSGSYSSYDGCVYTADGRHLLLCPQGKTGISFAPEILSVASGAFSGCSYLLSAVIPNAVSAIEANAFSGSAIRAVTIPASVTSIGPQSGWTPTVVYGYSGTTAESWANENNYIFESIDDPAGGISEESEYIEDPDPNNLDDPGSVPNPAPGQGGTPGTGSVTGTSTTTVHAASPGTSNGTSSAIAGSHVKDATPKTGVEEYGIYFLFGAVFLAGIALFAYSRKLRIDGNR